MVTTLGLGGVGGAVYVAVDTAPPPIGCVVTTVNTPQLAPLQPLPASDHCSTVLGFEPGTGVSVAATTAEPSGPTTPGAESCNEKLLLIVTPAEVCFEGSATLWAVIVTLAGFGRMGGAM